MDVPGWVFFKGGGSSSLGLYKVPTAYSARLLVLVSGLRFLAARTSMSSVEFVIESSHISALQIPETEPRSWEATGRSLFWDLQLNLKPYRV